MLNVVRASGDTAILDPGALQYARELWSTAVDSCHRLVKTPALQKTKDGAPQPPTLESPHSESLRSGHHIFKERNSRD